MGYNKWDPFKDLLLLQERMSQIFDETLIKYKGCASGSNAWYPPVDIYEAEDQVVLKAEIPGVEPDDVVIEVNENTLMLKGERRHKKNLADENYHRMERFYGSFQRAFSLPYAVDKDGVKANYKDGVLKIQIPKMKETPEGKIKVQIQ